MPRLFFALLLILPLAACGPQLVETDVTRFHSMAAPTAGQSFSIVPLEHQRGSIEFQTYADLVAAEMSRRGYNPVPLERNPDLVVRMAYGVDQGRTEVRSSPVYGSFGYGLGWGRPRYGLGLGATWPWGPDVVGMDYRSVTKYGKILELEILDGSASRRGAPQKLFEGRAVSESRARDLPAVMPYLVQALFDRFPGPSGQTVRVAIPVPGG